MNSTEKPFCSNEPSPTPTSEERPFPERKARILIADDHATERDYLKTALGYAGHEVLEAADGEEALEIVRSQRPDLVITDILMPKLDGLEFVRQMRSQPETAATRVIIWSATYRQDEAQTLAETMGVARLLKKPVEPGILLATIEEILRSPPPSLVPAAVLAKLEEAHQRLLNDKLYLKTLALEEEIAARQQIEVALRASEWRLRRFYDSGMLGVIYWNMDGKVTDANDKFLQMVGYSRDDLENGQLDWANMTPPEWRHLDERSVVELRSAGVNKVPLEKEYMRKDGTRLPILVAGAMLDEQRYEGVAFVLDISERKQIEQELRSNQQRFAGLVESAMDAIISIDAEQRIVLFNAAAEALFRCPAKEAIGSPIERFIPGRFRAAHEQHVRRFAASGTTSRAMGQLGTLWGLRADGEEFPIEASISKVPVGDEWLLSVILRDVTERRRAEAELEESRARLESILNSINDGVVVFDLSGNILDMNPVARRLHGYETDVQTCRQFPKCSDMFELRSMDGAIMPHHDWPMARALRGESFANLEIELRRQDGKSARTLSYSGTLVRSSARDEPILGVLTIRDVSDRKRLEEELRQLNQNLERRVEQRTAQLTQANEALLKSNEELQQFSFIASHDLQTPLRAIASLVQMLQRDYGGRLDEQADNLIGRVVDATRRLHALIRDMLVYSQVDSRAHPFQPVDFRIAFDEARATLEASIRETGAEVTRNELPVVLGDARQLTQLLQELLKNGIKYHGPEPPRVQVAAELRGGEWLFSVRDNGIGIPADQHKRIFQIFSRLHSAQAYPGTGIGLAMCRRVVERHGGRIWVESEPGKGSVFHFTLPQQSSAASP